MKIGQKITVGRGEDRESGVIDSIDGDNATVRWSSGDRTTQPICEIACVDGPSGERFAIHVVDGGDEHEVRDAIEAYLADGLDRDSGLVDYDVDTDDGRNFDGTVSAE